MDKFTTTKEDDYGKRIRAAPPVIGVAWPHP